MANQLASKIWQTIAAYQNIIIHRHVIQDYDALGSSFGLKELILSAWPNKNVHVVGETDPRFLLVPESEILPQDSWQGALVIVCDCNNTGRIDDDNWQHADFIIKIDHHEDFQPFGDLSWVDTSYVATAEMMIDLYLQGKETYPLKLSKKARLFFYCGILTDTGRFQFVHKAQAARLFAHIEYLVAPGDLSPFDIGNLVYRYTWNEVQIDGYIKLNFKRPVERMVYLCITEAVLQEHGWCFDEVRGKVNSMMGIIGVKVWALLVERAEEQKIYVELRSNGPVVNTIALKYGGGGHKLASGCKLDDWQQSEALLEDLKQAAAEL